MIKKAAIIDAPRNTVFVAQNGRDVGKRFLITEIDPLTLAGYALRLNSALRIASYESLMHEWREGTETGHPPIDTILRTLQGADPKAVHELITEALTYVRISPDPAHPGVERPLLQSDISELQTLGEVLAAIVQLNFVS